MRQALKTGLLEWICFDKQRFKLRDNLKSIFKKLKQSIFTHYTVAPHESYCPLTTCNFSAVATAVLCTEIAVRHTICLILILTVSPGVLFFSGKPSLQHSSLLLLSNYLFYKPSPFLDYIFLPGTGRILLLHSWILNVLLNKWCLQQMNE